MRLYDVLQPIAEYVRKLKKRETLTAKGEVRAVVGGNVTICTLTLKPNRNYVVIGGADISIGGDGTTNCALGVRNAKIVGGLSGVRTTAASGGGCSTSIYVRTQDKEGLVLLQGYGYISGTYDYSGSIIAIEL